jgi:hypothetical protein
MGRSVYITTPIPTLEEVGKSLKMSKARQQRLIEIMRGSDVGRFLERRMDASGPTIGSLRARKSAGTRTTPPVAAKASAVSKKGKRAATS